jgi:hypothetical protein
MLPFKLLYRRRPEVEHNNNNNNNNEQKKKLGNNRSLFIIMIFFLSLIFFWVEKPVLQERENDYISGCIHFFLKGEKKYDNNKKS